MRWPRVTGCAAFARSRISFAFEIGTKAEAEAFLEEMLRRGVFLRKPGAPPLDGYVRVTVGTAGERRRFAEIFAAALSALRSPASI